MKDNIFFRENFWEDFEKMDGNIHIIMIATKPDIVKQAPLFLELKKQNKNVVLIHTGQHYDYNLSLGALEEFSMEVDINLNISGENLFNKYCNIIEKLGEIFLKMKHDYNKNIIPYVHGDTLTATTADKAAFLNKIAVVHIEAGIRTFSLKKETLEKIFSDFENGNFNYEEFKKLQLDKNNFERGSLEPYPEQFDTRCVGPSSGIHIAPNEIYKETLLQEGFLENRIIAPGNTVSDVVKISLKAGDFEEVKKHFPKIREKEYIAITIHRRENCEVEERFKAFFYSLRKILEKGIQVVFLGLNASESAINNFNLREELEKLEKDFPEDFLYSKTPLAKHQDFISLGKNAKLIFTDSGSVQEEANIIGTPCITLRFGSDRIETIWAGCNLLVPPVNSSLIAEVIGKAFYDENLTTENLYGENVSEKIIDFVEKCLKEDKKLFLFDHERMKLEKYFKY